ncbi:MAG: hypothetical protein ACOZAR_01440 [Patescibacteria group bacterium]
MKEFNDHFGNSSDIHEVNIEFMSKYTKMGNVLGVDNIRTKKEYFDPEKVREDLIKKAQELAKKDCVRSLYKEIFGY